MATETLREFLAEIKWESNDAQQRRFVNALETATAKGMILGNVIEEAAGKVFRAVEGMASGFEKLYFTANQSGAGAGFLTSFEFAVKQLTGSAEEGKKAIADLARAADDVRNNHSRAKVYHEIGIDIDATTQKMTLNLEMMRKFKGMDTQYQGMWLKAAGIFDPAIQKNVLNNPDALAKLIDENNKNMTAAGFDPAKAAADGHAFESTWREIFNTLGNINSAFGDKVMATIQGPLDKADKWLKDHEATLSKLLPAAETAGAGVGVLGGLEAVLGKFFNVAPFTSTLLKGAGGGLSPLSIDAMSGGDEDTKGSPSGWAGVKYYWSKIFDPATYGLSPSTVRRKSGSANAFDQPLPPGATRGIDFGDRKSIGLLNSRAHDEEFGATGSGNGLKLSINGSPVGPGNPLPVTLDDSFKLGDGRSLGDIASVPDTGGGDGGRTGGGGRAGGGGPGDYGLGAARIAKGSSISRAVHFKNFMMKAFGLTNDQAIGIAGVQGFETGGFTTMQEKPSAWNHWGKDPGGYGYAQWTGPRRKAFFAWLKASGIKDPTSIEANEGFEEYEIRHNKHYMAAIEAVKRTQGVRAAAYSWEHGFEGMTEGGPGVPAFQQHMDTASAYAKLPQMQPGYFASQTGGDVDNSMTHNNVNQRVDIHVDGSMDPEITARMIGSHINRHARDLVRNLSGPAQ